MNSHLKHEVDKLKKILTRQCGRIESQVRDAVMSVKENNLKLAKQAIEQDKHIDTFEIEIEEECLKILALHQPVAVDLRYVIACLKVNNDLERIGDLACNIAKRSIEMNNFTIENDFSNLEAMLENVSIMLQNALASLVQIDIEKAIEVIKSDDKVDKLNTAIQNKIYKLIQQHPNQAEFYISLLNTSKHLERIADYTTNICEDVLYMTTGKIYRHHQEEISKKAVLTS